MIIEHSVFFLLGYCMLFSFEKLSKNNFCKNKISPKTYFIGSIFLKIKIFKEKSDLKINKYFYIIIIISLIFFWHIPIVFDFAYYDYTLHLLQHISFIIVGFCLYVIIKKLNFSFLFFSFILMGGLMGLFGLTLVLSTSPIYYSYSIESHINAGNYMIISFIMMMIVILPIFLIKKSINYVDNNKN